MYTEQELTELVKTVSETFSVHLASLAKSDGDPEKKEEPKEEAKEDKPEHKEEETKDAPPSEEKAPESKEEEKSPEGSEAPKEGGEQPPQEEKQADPSGEEHGYDDEDMKHMSDMYSSMSRPELKAHHDCIRKCMDGMGLAKCEEGMAKSEKDETIVLPQDNSAELELLKSELSAEKAKGEESKKNLEAVVESLAKFVSKSAPAGKSITSLDIIAKSEGGKEMKNLSKSEVTSILTKKASNPALSADDKQAINDYYFGSKNIETVRHLLG